MFDYQHKHTYKFPTSNKGFTLIEVVVALSLFTTVMLIAVSSLISLSDAQRRAEALRRTMDNVDFVVENMSRIIRTGSAYHCGSGGTLSEPANCVTGDDYLAFESASGSTIVFTVDNGQIKKSSNGGASFLGMTDPSVNIDTLAFYVDGALSGDLKQPRVLITVGGSVRVKDEIPTPFHLQTTVSQRLLDS